MAIEFTCPHCGAVTQVDPRFAGKSGPCATCGKLISIPAAQDNVVVETRRNTWVAVMIVGVALFAGLAVVGVLVALLLPAVNSAREAGRRAQCLNNVKQIATAIDSYRQQHQHFPPAYTVDENGRPLHSWRVLILPYLGPEANALYDRINLEEPWDSPVNAGYSNLMPAVFACPSDAGRGTNETSYCVVEGPGFLFDGAKMIPLEELEQGKGLASTLMLLETRDSMIDWMEPKDIQAANLAMGMNSGEPGCCGSYHPRRGAWGAFADGTTTYFVESQYDPDRLAELATWKSQEPIAAP